MYKGGQSGRTEDWKNGKPLSQGWERGRGEGERALSAKLPISFYPAGAFGGMGPTWYGRIISLSS